MGFLESLAMGLRQGGGVLSPGVFQQNNALEQQSNQMEQQKKMLVGQQIIKGIESGAIDPQKGQAVLQQIGFGQVPVGMDPVQAEKIQAVKEQLATRKFIQENAKFFVDENGNFQPRKMVSAIAQRDPVMASTVAKNLGVDFEQKPMVLGENGTLVSPEGQVIATGKPKEKITWGEPFEGPRGTTLQRSSDGQIRTVVGPPPNVSVHNPPAVTLADVIDPDPNSPTYGKPITIDARTGRKIGTPAPKDTGEGKPIPTPLITKLTDHANLANNAEKFASDFKDSYAGFVFDSAGNLVNQIGKRIGDETNRLQWWQAYELHQSRIRLELYGTAFTKAEKEIWDRSTVTPGMKPSEVKKNLAARQKVEVDAVNRLMNGIAAGGYNKKQIEAFTGRTLPGSEDKFVVGNTYTDKNGNRAIYRGNGNWEEAK